MDRVTKIMVNSKYFPKSGIASDVGGIISANSRKNTVNERRMEEHNDTCKISEVLCFINMCTYSCTYIVFYLHHIYSLFHLNHLVGKKRAP